MADLRRINRNAAGDWSGFTRHRGSLNNGRIRRIGNRCANHEHVVDNRAGRAWEMLVAAFPVTHRRKVRNQLDDARLLTADPAPARYSPASRSGAE
jgi:hypothetical protein